MIIVIANAYLKKNKENEFLQAAKACIEGTRKEEGNISYNLNKSTEIGDQFGFVEEWKSQEDLDLHMKTDHFISFGRDIEQLLTKPLEIKVYVGEKVS